MKHFQKVKITARFLKNRFLTLTVKINPISDFDWDDIVDKKGKFKRIGKGGRRGETMIP